MPEREPPVKLYYRIGEVSEIVGVEPHVLRYWETEFRSIRPQKSRKGQRIYSRRDVEKLLRVKDLLYNHGFTIAGARRRLREPAELSEVALEPAAQAEAAVAPEPAAQLSSVESALARERGTRAALIEMRREIVDMLNELDAGVALSKKVSPS